MGMNENELMFQAVFDQSSEFIQLLSIEGRQLDANTAALNFIGLEKDDLIGKFFWETPWWSHSQELQEQIRSAVAKAAKGQLARFEAMHPSADGNPRIVDFCIKPAMDQKGNVAFLISEGRDITDRKRTEVALRRSDTELRSFIERSPFGVFRSSIEQDRFLEANPALVDMLGYDSAEDLCFASLSENIFSDPQDRLHVLHLLLKEGSVYGLEMQFRKRAGETITVSLNGRLVQDSLTGDLVIEGTVEDISDRKRAEQALRESEEHFRQVVETTPVGIYIVTDGLLRYLNPAALAMFGAESPGQIIGKGYLEVIHADSQPFVRERARIVAEAKRAVPLFEERLLRLDGTIFDGEATAIPFVFERRDGALVFVRDVTETKREGHERRELEQRLRHAQKMEAVGRLAGGIAHDFNNLLMVIQSCAEMAQRGLPAHDPMRKNIREIMKAAERAASLTGQLLAFSRKQINSPIVLDLLSLVKETARMLKRLIGEDIELRVEMGELLWAIEADSDQIVQVLMNLCLNSRDAMPQGGTLAIAIENINIDERTIGDHPYVVPGEYVKITVTDTGTGITKEKQENIFEPFFTTKDVGEGTGLGLATVYGIVKQNGGYVWVDSELGRGACFTICLPRASSTVVYQTTMNHDARLARAHPTGTDILLVAEDEDALRESICSYLRTLGYTVFSAGSGQEALSLASQQTRIDLLITDVVMPKMSGTKLSQLLASVYPGLKTLYMSGYTEDEVLRRGIHGHRAQFLQKPFNLNTLARKVRETFEQTES
jgi:PAS domain S-box-containing protein